MLVTVQKPFCVLSIRLCAFKGEISKSAPHFLRSPWEKSVAHGSFCTLQIASVPCLKHICSFFVSIIFQEIISSLPNIVNDKYGRKVLLYLLSPRDPAHTVREIIEVLQKGDGNAHR